MVLTPSHTSSFQLSSDEVHCWCVTLDASPEDYARLHAILSHDERSRSARFPFERDRRRFVVAHGVLRELLACYLQIRPGEIHYVYNAFGKPDLSAEFGNRLKFNLSHSSSLALIAIALNRNIGIDVEHIRVQPDYMEIARRFFTAAEVNYLKRIPGHLCAHAFFSCWTRMEAYVKACGEGLAKLDGDSNNISPDRHWSFYTLRPAPNYIGSLAIEGSGRPVTQWHWISPATNSYSDFQTGPPH